MLSIRKTVEKSAGTMYNTEKNSSGEELSYGGPEQQLGIYAFVERSL